MKKATKKKPAERNSKLSTLELGFLRVWEMLFGLETRPIMQHRFAAPERQWRFDFAWPNQKVAVEIDGGIFVGGAHNRGVKFTGDCEKLNAAVFRGWRVLRYTTLDMRQRPIPLAEEIKRLLDTVEELNAATVAYRQQQLVMGDQQDEEPW